MEEPPSTRSALRAAGSHRSDSQDEPGQSSVGSATHSWGTVETGIGTIRGHRRQVHGASSQTTLANLAHVPGKPYEGFGLLRLLRGSDRVLSCVICLRDSVARPPAARPRRGDGASYGRMGGSPTVGSLSVGQRSALFVARSGWELRREISRDASWL